VQCSGVQHTHTDARHGGPDGPAAHVPASCNPSQQPPRAQSANPAVLEEWPQALHALHLLGLIYNKQL
jgi:hypothetical protein